jgi:hypothetical protein
MVAGTPKALQIAAKVVENRQKPGKTHQNTNKLWKCLICR